MALGCCWWRLDVRVLAELVVAAVTVTVGGDGWVVTVWRETFRYMQLPLKVPKLLNLAVID